MRFHCAQKGTLEFLDIKKTRPRQKLSEEQRDKAEDEGVVLVVSQRGYIIHRVKRSVQKRFSSFWGHKLTIRKGVTN